MEIKAIGEIYEEKTDSGHMYLSSTEFFTDPKTVIVEGTFEIILVDKAAAPMGERPVEFTQKVTKGRWFWKRAHERKATHWVPCDEVLVSLAIVNGKKWITKRYEDEEQ
jgi:hypothetical protein